MPRFALSIVSGTGAIACAQKQMGPVSLPTPLLPARGHSVVMFASSKLSTIINVERTWPLMFSPSSRSLSGFCHQRSRGHPVLSISGSALPSTRLFCFAPAFIQHRGLFSLTVNSHPSRVSLESVIQHFCSLARKPAYPENLLAAFSNEVDLLPA
jgi:hypothetical protein